ncbi:MAG: Trm112 family protein [Acidimicrobiia bacterium]|nr:Trm112 family protein [Acidimicrobiia bacterium]
MSLDPRLLEILACPACKQGLIYAETEPALVCPDCRLLYRIEDDIPVMLVDEARAVPESELGRYRRPPS